MTEPDFAGKTRAEVEEIARAAIRRVKQQRKSLQYALLLIHGEVAGDPDFVAWASATRPEVYRAAEDEFDFLCAHGLAMAWKAHGCPTPKRSAV